MIFDEKKYKEKLIEILVVYDKFCRKYNLRYTLYGGTLIGAVRHKGFIPWDDDIDVLMPRPDYDKFLDLTKKGISDGYKVVSPYTDKYYYLGFAKVTDENTSLIEYEDFSDTLFGVYIDVFPLDGTFEDKILSDNQYVKYYNIMSEVRRICHTPHLKDLFHRDELGRRIIGVKSFIRNFYEHRFVSTLPIIQRADNCLRLCDYNRSNKVRIFGSIFNNKHCFQREWFDEYVELEFEGKHFMAIKEWDLWLSMMYGDYMALPPKEKRIPHHQHFFVNLEHAFQLKDIRKMGY